MNQGKVIAIAGLVLIGVIVASSTMYTVDERETAIVLRFGKVIRYDDRPGLHFKTPFLESVSYFDKRILTLDAEARPYLTAEKKSLLVDSFVKWRIIDTLKFYLTMQGDEANARTRLQQVVQGGLRTEFGKRPLTEIISGDRSVIMDIMRVEADKAAREFGIEVVDVRLQRVDLPEDVSDSVYHRMEAERARIAKELRAQGAEVAEKIRAEAERKREILLAEAYRDAERIRGEGDATATATYAKAFGQNREFYRLYRSLSAYKQSFQGKEDVLIVDPSSEFFRYLKKPIP